MTTIVLTSGVTWTPPSDWTTTNTIETWGAGGGGSSFNTANGKGGGGGGAYSSISNISTLTIGVPVVISIGAGGRGENSSLAPLAGGGKKIKRAILRRSSVGCQ